MKRHWISTAVSLVAFCLLAGLFVFADDDKVELKGMIISRSGDTLVVKNPNGNTTVVLTDDTKTKDNKGLLGMRKEYMSNTVLIPGLKLKVDGATDEQGRVVAKTITVDGDDLETAEMIQAGVNPTAQQAAATQQQTEQHKEQIAQNTQDIQENTERFNKLGEYDVKGNATVNFDVGSSKLSQEDMKQLNDLAQNATRLTGYLIEVKGFADSSGNAIMNEKLSEDRADAVVAYLVQRCNVPVRHIVAPGALGEYQPVASNETVHGRAANRRVEVNVLVNKGIVAGK